VPPSSSGKNSSRRFSCLTLKTKAARVSKTSVNIYQSTWRTSQSLKSSHQRLLEENRTYIHLRRSESQTFVLTRLTLSISTLPCPLLSRRESSDRSDLYWSRHRNSCSWRSLCLHSEEALHRQAA
jgi:hypothetical protein